MSSFKSSQYNEWCASYTLSDFHFRLDNFFFSRKLIYNIQRLIPDLSLQYSDSNSFKYISLSIYYRNSQFPYEVSTSYFLYQQSHRQSQRHAEVDSRWVPRVDSKHCIIGLVAKLENGLTMAWNMSCSASQMYQLISLLQL